MAFRRLPLFVGLVARFALLAFGLPRVPVVAGFPWSAFASIALFFALLPLSSGRPGALVVTIAPWPILQVLPGCPVCVCALGTAGSPVVAGCRALFLRPILNGYPLFTALFGLPRVPVFGGSPGLVWACLS